MATPQMALNIIPTLTDIVSLGSTNAAAANNQTFTGLTGRTFMLNGFNVSGLGATAGSTITITVTGLAGGTLTYYIPIPTGAGTAITPLAQTYGPYGLPGTPGTNVVVNVPSFGAGNTNAAVAAWGYYV